MKRIVLAPLLLAAACPPPVAITLTSTPDPSPPTVELFFIPKPAPRFSKGETYTLSVKARDPESGIASVTIDATHGSSCVFPDGRVSNASQGSWELFAKTYPAASVGAEVPDSRLEGVKQIMDDKPTCSKADYETVEYIYTATATNYQGQASLPVKLTAMADL